MHPSHVIWDPLHKIISNPSRQNSTIMSQYVDHFFITLIIGMLTLMNKSKEKNYGKLHDNIVNTFFILLTYWCLLFWVMLMFHIYTIGSTCFLGLCYFKLLHKKNILMQKIKQNYVETATTSQTMLSFYLNYSSL